jgi:transcriptional regulator with XRE-family HTH domain
MEGTIASRIKKIREIKKLTQKQLAEKANMGEVQVQKYEYGIIKPKAAQLARLAYALEVDVAFLQPSKMVTENSILAVLYDLLEDYDNIKFSNNGATVMFGVESMGRKATNLNLVLAEAVKAYETSSSIDEFKEWLVNYESTKRRPLDIL